MSQSKVGKRADKEKVVDIKNPKNSRGQYVLFDGETRLRKEVEQYTMTCDMENCDGIGRYDERGEVVCEDCGRVISQNPDGGPSDLLYPEDNFGGNDAGSSDISKGASGHPLMRTPALRGAGPKTDSGLGGIS